MISNTVFLSGCTGKVGRAALRHLSKRPGMRIVAGLRRPEYAVTLRNDVDEIRHFDLDIVETLKPALSGVDSALLITSYSVDMLRQSIRFLEAAKSVGISHIVHVGASGTKTAEIAHWGWHRLVECYIEKLGFRYTHLQPEAFMQNVLGAKHHWLDNDVLHHYVGEACWTWVDATDVGEVAAEALCSSATHSGKSYRLGADRKTMMEVAEILSRAFDRPIRAQSHSPFKFLSDALDAGADSTYMQSVYHQFQLDEQGTIACSGTVYPDIELVLGRPATTWEGFAKQWASNLS